MENVTEDHRSFFSSQTAVCIYSTQRQQNKALCVSWAPHRAGKTEYGTTNDDVENVEQQPKPVVVLKPSLSPFLTGRMFVRPNILRTLRQTMIRFLIELLVRRIWFGQSKLYFILNWLVMRCKLRPELAADAQQTA